VLLVACAVTQLVFRPSRRTVLRQVRRVALVAEADVGVHDRAVFQVHRLLRLVDHALRAPDLRIRTARVLSVLVARLPTGPALVEAAQGRGSWGFDRGRKRAHLGPVVLTDRPIFHLAQRRIRPHPRCIDVELPAPKKPVMARRIRDQLEDLFQHIRADSLPDYRHP